MGSEKGKGEKKRQSSRQSKGRERTKYIGNKSEIKLFARNNKAEGGAGAVQSWADPFHPGRIREDAP